MTEYFVAWFLFSVFAGFIANSKGQSFFKYFAIAALLSPIVGIIVAALAKESPNQK